jgi:two-component system NarL family response regulator
MTEPPDSPLRVAIVEDDDVTRESLAILLGGEPSLIIAGAFPTARALLDAAGELDADVLLADLGLPDADGPELIAAIKSVQPRWEVLAYTISEARQTVFAALRAGAVGYILKGCAPRELVEALHAVAGGGAPMSPRIARMLVRELQVAGGDSDDTDITARERDVLSHLERGLPYKEVARALHISPHTVHSHVKRIYDKLHARNRQEAIRAARLRGLI